MDLSVRPTVVLTREHEDNLELLVRLQKCGVEVREIPCLATRYIRPARLPGKNVGAVVFTSKRGVRGWVRLEQTNNILQGFEQRLVAAVGEATAAELEAAGIRADLVAARPEGRVLAELLVKKLASCSRVVVVCGNLRGGGLDVILERAGHELEHVMVYENVKPKIPILEPFPVAAVYVSSPSAAQRLVENNPWFKEHLFYAIGPTTALALGELGVARIEQVGARSEQVAQVLCNAFRHSAK